MKKLTEQLIKMVNKCILGGTELELDKYLKLVEDASVDNKHQTHLLRLSAMHTNLRELNRQIYDYNYCLEQSAKHTKSMDKFNHSQDDDDQLKEDFDKFHDYVYSLMSTKNYKSRVSKSKAKVHLFNIHTIYGDDEEESLRDVQQEGRLYLWEGLKKYGYLPKKAKNFKGRLDGGGFKRTKSSKSTFVFQNLKNNYINLGSKANSDKYRHINIEFKPEILSGEGNNE